MLRLNHVTFACEDSRPLAEFWASVLGYETELSGDDCFARGEGRPALFFKRMPKSPTIELPIHLDVNVPDRAAEVQRLLGIGARLVETRTTEIGELHEEWTVMRDPEGNGFCVQAPPGTTRPYLGNVTFSSAAPRRLGAFWSEALGWPEQDVPDDFLQMLWDAGLDRAEYEAYYSTLNPDGTRPRFLFQRREKSRPDHYPIHLDFWADDRESEIERLGSLGAAVEQTKRAGDRTWTIMRDPEGNPFCVEELRPRS